MPLTTLADTSHSWSDFLRYVPFVGLAFGKHGSNPFFTRIIEAIIIAIFAGYISSQITLAVMEVRMASVEKKVDKIYNDILTINNIFTARLIEGFRKLKEWD